MTLFMTKNLYLRKEFLRGTFFSRFILCHASNNTTSLNIGGPMHGPSPPHIWQGRDPRLPKSSPVIYCLAFALCACLWHGKNCSQESLCFFLSLFLFLSYLLPSQVKEWGNQALTLSNMLIQRVCAGWGVGLSVCL